MIRDARPTDVHYLVDSWVGSYGDASAVAKSMTPAVYKSRWFALASHLVATGRVVIDCDETSPGVILAWACHDGAGTLHYLFTREDWRRQGRAKALVKAIAPRLHTYSARTTFWQQIPLGRSWKYDPAVAWAGFHQALHESMANDHT